MKKSDFPGLTKNNNFGLKEKVILWFFNMTLVNIKKKISLSTYKNYFTIPLLYIYERHINNIRENFNFTASIILLFKSQTT